MNHIPKYTLYIAGVIIILISWCLYDVYATDGAVKMAEVDPAPQPQYIPVPAPKPCAPNETECAIVDYATLYYTDTNVDNVQEFLEAMPECDWCVACGSYARYTYLEANKRGLAVGGITRIDPDQARVKARLVSGHRMNYFESDGETYYIDNTRMHRKILRRHEIPMYTNDTYGIYIALVAFKDIKPPRAEVN